VATRAPHQGQARDPQRYLGAWFPILTSSGWNRRVIFLDGFAGPGRYTAGEPGSPIIALDTLVNHRHFQKLQRTEFVMIFVESDDQRFASLEEEKAFLHDLYEQQLHDVAGCEFVHRFEMIGKRGKTAYSLYFGARADSERYAVFTDGEQVRMVVAIDRIEDSNEDGRREIVGRPLRRGNKVHDGWIGRKIPGTRNPVRYIDAPEDARPCRCGCGAELVRSEFAAGHDQRAIHERIAKIGTVAAFCDWFDATYRG
jgi:hypothetical protein